MLKKWFKKFFKSISCFFFLHNYLCAAELENFQELNLQRLLYLIAHFKESENTVSRLALSKETANQVDSEGIMGRIVHGEISSKGLRPLSYAAKVLAPDAAFIFLLNNGADPFFKETILVVKYEKTDCSEVCCWPLSFLCFQKKPIPSTDHALFQIRKIWKETIPNSAEYKNIERILKKLNHHHPQYAPFSEDHARSYHRNQIAVINDKQIQNSFFGRSPQIKKKHFRKTSPIQAVTSHDQCPLLYSPDRSKIASASYRSALSIASLENPFSSDDEMLPG
jgi:hypothetical protein